MWSNLTISITNMKFKAEYSYEDLINNAFNSYERHVIWRYKYLGIGPEQVSKKDKDILFRYFNGARTLAETEEYNAGIYIEQDTKNIIEYNTQENEIENDGYIREDDIQTIGIDRKYNQIHSHKIENNWDANIRKKQETMWSHDNKSAEQYIIKSSRNILNIKNNKNHIKTDKREQDIVRKASQETISKTQDEIRREKMRKIQEEISKRKNSNTKMETEKKKTNRPIRNQILFSEDEEDGE